MRPAQNMFGGPQLAARYVAMLNLTTLRECSLVYVERSAARPAASLMPGQAACASRTRPVYFLMYTTIVDGIIPARLAAAASS